MLRIHLLGQIRLFVDDRPFKFLVTSRTVPLLSYLLLHGREPVQRNWLAYKLWPDNSESDARGNLRRFLHELRHLLPPEEGGDPWILADASTLQWNPHAAPWLDVEAFETAASLPSTLAEAVSLYAGDLLPDLYDDWIIADRERLRNRFLDSLFRLLVQARQERRHMAALGYAQQLLHHDPLREDAVRELMAVRAASGDRTGALQEYQRFEQRIRSELGVAPMIETSALYESIARQVAIPSTSITSEATAPVAAATGVPPLADASPPHNLPAQLTAFVGRETEMAALQTLLGDARTPIRLLTLTGPGGSGKSRLAVEFAARLRAQSPDRFPNGCFLVGLASVRSPELVLPAIAEVLRVPETPGQPLIESLRATLRPRRTLLLLDNFEHLLDAAPLITDLLATAPGLRIVVTSRATLRIYGEHEFQVPPLPIPAEGALPALGELARVGSVALFVARSRAVNPSFTLNTENAADVARICIELDGLPLALELAAARSKLLAPAAILARLEHRLSFLVARDRQVHDRHQTLRAALDWSYNLLGEGEQRLLRRLAVFAASFTLEAADALAAPTGVRSSAEEMLGDAGALAGIENLLDNSLLQPMSEGDEGETPGLGGGARLRMLATVREYALERLAEQGEEQEAYALLARFMLDLLEKSQTGLRGGAQGIWLRHLEMELDNLRAALRWCLGPSGNAEWGLVLASSAALFWLVAGHWSEGVEWLQQALESNRDAPPVHGAPAFTGLGFLIMARGDLAPAAPFFEEAIRLYKILEDPRGLSDALYGLGRLRARQRNFTQGEALIQESLAIARSIGYEWRISYDLIILSMIALETDDLERAAAQTALALESAQRVQNKIGMAQMHTALGELHRIQGDYPRAEADYNQALALANELGQKARIMMVEHNLGYVALYHGDVRRSAAHFRAALRLGQELTDKENFGMCLLGLGGVAAAEGHARRAALLFGAGEAALRALGADLASADRVEYERNRARALALTTPELFARHLREGRSLAPDAAEALAFSD